MTKRPSPDPSSSALPAPPDDLCLEFANTRFWRGRVAPEETLHGIEDVLAWCASKAALPAERRRALRRRWRGADGVSAVEEAVRWREVLHRIFGRVASGATPAPEDLRLLNGALAAAPARAEIRPVASGYGWSVAAAEASVLTLLAPVLWSAADLLVGKRLAKVRQCANPECLWLFLDDSKSGTRRWCFMSSCGNRAKVHRHYLRRKRAARRERS